MFGTTVLARNCLLERIVRFSWELVRTTKQLGSVGLDCIQLEMTAVKPSKCSVILIPSPGFRGT